MMSRPVRGIAAALSRVACRVGAEKTTTQKGRAPMEGRAPTAWKNLTAEELAARKQALPRDAYQVTQKEGTEPPFHNALWDQHAPGIYVDVASGEPLFPSNGKFDS